MNNLCSCDECARYPVDRLRQIERSYSPAATDEETHHTREAAYIHRYGVALRASEQYTLHRERVALLVKLAGIQITSG
jgi:hypothetical protein